MTTPTTDTHPTPETVEQDEALVVTVARQLYCADEGITEEQNKAHLDYWFCNPDPGDEHVMDGYRAMARAIIPFVTASLSSKLERAIRLIEKAQPLIPTPLGSPFSDWKEEAEATLAELRSEKG